MMYSKKSITYFLLHINDEKLKAGLKNSMNEISTIENRLSCTNNTCLMRVEITDYSTHNLFYIRQIFKKIQSIKKQGKRFFIEWKIESDQAKAENFIYDACASYSLPLRVIIRDKFDAA